MNNQGGCVQWAQHQAQQTITQRNIMDMVIPGILVTGNQLLVQHGSKEVYSFYLVRLQFPKKEREQHISTLSNIVQSITSHSITNLVSVCLRTSIPSSQHFLPHESCYIIYSAPSIIPNVFQTRMTMNKQLQGFPKQSTRLQVKLAPFMQQSNNHPSPALVQHSRMETSALYKYIIHLYAVLLNIRYLSKWFLCISPSKWHTSLVLFAFFSSLFNVLFKVACCCNVRMDLCPYRSCRVISLLKVLPLERYVLSSFFQWMLFSCCLPEKLTNLTTMIHGHVK